MADVSLPTIDVSAQARAATSPAKPASAAPDAAKPAHKSFWPSFHDVLSAMNPLQYVPVVGTIYRSATGDTIPENTRMVGSLVFSGLTSGPIGVATSLATDFLEKVTGIDPEKIGHNILTSLGIGGKSTTATADAKHPAAPAASATTGAPRALTDQELAAYGVKKNAEGELRRGELEGADVLNSLELARLTPSSGKTLAVASTAYDRIAVPRKN
jgi:hypothetical protein